ncbi:MAG: phytanoyl-CoA dioxygenase family protein [Candidatus Poribacteria bacterium]|nr:phytanoyl-CoA dioxygenase family protein [Candidatus Poribacteria bacterium]
MDTPLLTAEEAITKRWQLMDDGFCIIPGVMRGEMLKRVAEFTDDFLDEHPVDPRYRYQGSDFHIATEEVWQQNPKLPYHDPIVKEIIELKPALDALEAIGLEGIRKPGSIIILSKPAHGPSLYWHQDAMSWNHPMNALPWPNQIFLSYYTVDTNLENGCLKAIPGTHLKRHPLHDVLPPAHGQEIQALDESHPAFHPHPDEVDIPVAAGDLVVADARVLHAARPNKTDKRRPLVLAWFGVFPFPTTPSWWDRDIPPEIKIDPTIQYEGTRTPGKYLRP